MNDVRRTEEGTPLWGTRRAPAVPYLPGLDGLRALSVIAVIVYHAGGRSNWLGGGFLGVEVFFVISGYLITLLLIAERERTGHVSLKNFWLRRARRLLPALWTMMVGIVLYCAVFFRDPMYKLRGEVVAGFTYVTNWFQIWTGSSYDSAREFAGLRHLWSLAVEEQFYLLWPLVMFVVLRRIRKGTLPTVGLWFITIAVAITITNFLVYSTEALNSPAQKMSLLGHSVNRVDFLYLGSFSRASGLLLGAGLAMFWRPWSLERGNAGRSSLITDVMGVVGLVALGVMFYNFRLAVVTPEGRFGYDLLYRGGLFLVGVASVAAIMCVTHPHSFLGRYVIGNPVFKWVGLRSYGLYLYHWPVFQGMRRFSTERPLTSREVVVASIVTLIIAEVSYRVIEMPIRQGQLAEILSRWRNVPLRDRAYVRRRAAILSTGVLILPTLAVVSLVRADVNGGTEMSEDISTTTVPTGATTSTTTNESPVTTTDPQVKANVLAVGDSVMLGATGRLMRAGITVDAAKDRLFGYSEQIFNYLKSIDQLSDKIVIHLGTNGGVRQSTLDRILSSISQAKLVILVTTYGPGLEWAAQTNTVLRDAPSRFPNVQVLDWAKIGKEHPEYFADDGIHLASPTGTEAYVAEILRALGS